MPSKHADTVSTRLCLAEADPRHALLKMSPCPS